MNNNTAHELDAPALCRWAASSPSFKALLAGLLPGGVIGRKTSDSVSVSVGVRPEFFPDNDQKIDKCVSYMKEHLTERLSARRLASIAHVSRSHFFVLFRLRTGKAPIEYFIQLRMQQGARLLESTAMNVKNVAAAVGYEDAFYFSRLFKSEYKLSPSDFRAQLHARNAAALNE